MLAVKRSAGVTPEVNLRNPLGAGDDSGEESTLALKPRLTSPEVQNRGFNGCSKSTDVFQYCFTNLDNLQQSLLKYLRT